MAIEYCPVEIDEEIDARSELEAARSIICKYI